MRKEIKKLTVKFWFGQKRPVDSEDMFFTYDFNTETIGKEWDNFKLTYIEFKKRNMKPVVPYENCLENEECIIDYETGSKLTKFQELLSITKLINNEQNKIDKLENEIKELENEMYSVVDNTMKEYPMQTLSLSEVFTNEQLSVIETIYNKNLQYPKLQKELKKYFKKIKTQLKNKGYDYNYLAYAVSYSLVQEAA